VASNIVQGIGFLGAGLILHNRSRISGLTSAASIWVVASIGMACGRTLRRGGGGGDHCHHGAGGGRPSERRANMKAYPLCV